ncbi:alpha/beta fold hydrolase [Desulfovibrio sp. OttesenSCG-928-M16]|nr:alpha/beta fold hydrolase [Desulfovibrio sp. OttesenSCG-928-M16]
MSCACLLIHGFAGSPFEMEALVPGLEALDCTVDLPALPGHDAGLEAFKRSFFPDWLAFAEERFLALCQKHDMVIPIGFSMGGSIALSIAAKHSAMPQTGGVVGLAPAHTILNFPPKNKKEAWLWLTPVMQYLKPQLDMAVNLAAQEIAPFKGIESPLCLPQLWSLIKGVAAMRGLLPNLHKALFLMYDLHDRVCPPENALRIAKDVSSKDVTVRWLRMEERVTSHHMLTTHRETRGKVASEVAAFVARIAGHNQQAV